jgi:hypothetical protein
MNEHMDAKTVTGAKRYSAGVMKYAQMGYWEPDYEPKDTDVIALFRITPQDGWTRSKPRPPWRERARRQHGQWSGPTA